MTDYRYQKGGLDDKKVDRLEEKNPIELIQDYREQIEMHEEDKVRIDKQITKCNSEIKKIEDAMKQGELDG